MWWWIQSAAAEAICQLHSHSKRSEWHIFKTATPSDYILCSKKGKIKTFSDKDGRSLSLTDCHPKISAGFTVGRSMLNPEVECRMQEVMVSKLICGKETGKYADKSKQVLTIKKQR